MKQLQNNIKIGISGLGLIGGSIFKALVNKGFTQIFAHSQNTETISKIKAIGFNADKDISILKECDVIFVCSPISATINSVKSMHKTNQNAIILDTASLKADILEEIEKIENCKFIGSHPMAGTENSGFDAAFGDLFIGAKWILTPSKYAVQNDIELIKEIINTIGAKPLIMDSKEHDKAVAMISHMPMLLSQSLMLSVINNESCLKLASSGFRDMTRLAMSNKTMAKDMLTLNKTNIKKSLETIIENANKLLSSNYFDDNIDKIISSRQNLYNHEGKNIY